MSRVAVLVLNYNGRHHLGECFAALSEQSYSDFDTYLVDNASDDSSCEFVADRFPWVRLLRMPANLGLPAYNQAIKTLDHELVALLNNDTAAEPIWLAELVAAIDGDVTVAACTSKMVFMDNPSIINHAGGAITWLGLGYDIGFGQQDAHEFNQRCYVGSFCGGAALLRREIFHSLGGFDDSYFAYLEDVDLSWRLALQKHRVLYVPTSVVRHKYGASFGQRGSLLREYLCERNRWANMIKNVGSHRLFPLLVVSFGFHLMKVIEHILLGRARHALVTITGLRDVIRLLPRLLELRREIQDARRVSDRNLVVSGTVVPLLAALRERWRLGWA